jgi:hypothetical protein
MRGVVSGCYGDDAVVRTRDEGITERRGEERREKDDKTL